MAKVIEYWLRCPSSNLVTVALEAQALCLPQSTNSLCPTYTTKYKDGLYSVP